MIFALGKNVCASSVYDGHISQTKNFKFNRSFLGMLRP